MRFSKLTKPELDYFLENANFTEEEEKYLGCFPKENQEVKWGWKFRFLTLPLTEEYVI